MKNIQWAGFAVAGGLLLAAGPVFAHHGAGNWDNSHLVTLMGTVTEFEFINPHAKIHLDVKDRQGNLEKWTVELGSPNSMRRSGWSSKTIKPGDPIRVSGFRAKNGGKVMGFRKLVLPDGKEFGGDALQ